MIKPLKRPSAEDDVQKIAETSTESLLAYLMGNVAALVDKVNEIIAVENEREIDHG